MLSHQAAFLTLILCSFMYMVCDGCDPDQIVRGCMIQTGQCFCGMGCMSEFRYKTRDECKAALNGDSLDVCQRKPCANNGACIQTSSTSHRFKCRCEGTGYYGPRCQFPCPSLGSSIVKVFPYECIEI